MKLYSGFIFTCVAGMVASDHSKANNANISSRSLMSSTMEELKISDPAMKPSSSVLVDVDGSVSSSKDNLDPLRSDGESSLASTYASNPVIPLRYNEKGYVDTKEPRMFDQKTEEEGCKQIIDALTDEEKMNMADPNMPMRHFRADKGNIKSAIKSTKYAIKWRKEFRVDDILASVHPDSAPYPSSNLSDETDFKSILQYESSTGKIYVRNHDNQGRAIMYMRPQRENSVSAENNIINLVYHIERAISCTKKSGLEKIVMILDFDGYKLRHAPPMSTTKATIHVLEKCYPERLGRAYICNAPLVFRTFWNIVRPFLDPVTKDKVVFCSGKAGMQELKDNFDETKLENCAFGTNDLKEFDHEEYLADPFHRTFDDLS